MIYLEDIKEFLFRNENVQKAFSHWTEQQIRQMLFDCYNTGLIVYEVNIENQLVGAAIARKSEKPNTVFVLAIVVTDGGSVTALLRNFASRFPRHNIEGLRRGKLKQFGTGEQLLKRLCNLNLISV